MAASLVAHTVRSGSLGVATVLREFRRRREILADQEVEGFEARLLNEVASSAGISVPEVKTIISDWIDYRPLPKLMSCRYPGVNRIFDRLRASGRKIGILSDYPAHAKLFALGLDADYVVSASEVGVLKPHPRGLLKILQLAGEGPETAVLVGDRAERDGESAKRAGVKALIRTSTPLPEYVCFQTFDDPLFNGI